MKVPLFFTTHRISQAQGLFLVAILVANLVLTVGLFFYDDLVL